jgi:hypothetical protein
MQHILQDAKEQRFVPLVGGEVFSTEHQIFHRVSKKAISGVACAEADKASIPATVKARITFIFIGNSWRAGSAYADVTYVDDPPLQLLCNYYLIYIYENK